MKKRDVHGKQTSSHALLIDEYSKTTDAKNIISRNNFCKNDYVTFLYTSI